MEKKNIKKIVEISMIYRFGTNKSTKKSSEGSQSKYQRYIGEFIRYIGEYIGYIFDISRKYQSFFEFFF